MKYKSPENRTEKEVIEILSRIDNDPEERILAVLSAVYYGKTINFSGDILIEEFKKAKYDEKRWLKNIFETFYGMYRTNYRIDDSIMVLTDFERQNPEYSLDIKSTIEALAEYKSIFNGDHSEGRF
ncbi:hypothetical protein [Agrobacterium sp. M50-1]|uniref:hypothetical protein n=1 Tax=Agrobacterium sp. M50-1 TaxID=3132821 RepID=UPI003CE45B78